MQEKLLDLVEKFKKNSKLSMSDRKIFDNELGIIIGRGDYNNEIEIVLCEGPIDITMKALAQYLAHVDIEVANDLLNKFIHCNGIKENKGGTSGMRLVPLCCFYMDEKGEQDEIVNKLFLNAIKYAYKNDRSSFNKKVVEEVRKILVPRILAEDKKFDLSFVFNDKTWCSIRDLFIESMLQGDKANYHEVEKLYKWLYETGKDMGQYNEEYLLKRIMDNEEKINNTHQEKKVEGKKTKEKSIEEEKGNDKKDVVSKDADNSKIKKNTDLEKIVGAIGTVVLAETKEISRIREEQKEMIKRFDNLVFQLGKSQDKIEQQANNIKDLYTEKQQLQVEKKEYVEKIEVLEKTIENLQKEVTDQKQFTDTVSRNREKQSEEFLNRLASKLKIDYRDYLDAKDLEMTIDLGENMREQLGAIFSILEKNGISFN